MKVPESAATIKPASLRQSAPCAYIPNPLMGKERLTPSEAVDAISKLSAMLVADDRYRASLDGRGAPEIVRNDHVGQ